MKELDGFERAEAGILAYLATQLRKLNYKLTTQ